jgi:hypothetical protein
METFGMELSAEKFDEAVHGPKEGQPSLRQAGPINVYVKPNGTHGGRAVAVITFLARLPDGTIRRVQATTTAALLEAAAHAITGWRHAGKIT